MLSRAIVVLAALSGASVIAKMLGLVLAPEDDAGSVEERIARLSAAADAHQAGARTWREGVVRFQLAELQGGSGGVRGVATGDNGVEAPAAWTVGPAARWVRPPGGERMDLARHGSLRRVLDALVTRRLEAPGVAWSPGALIEAGWPDERVRYQSGLQRVYSVIRRLRALGLGGVLITRDDGYLIDPEIAVVRATTP